MGGMTLASIRPGRTGRRAAVLLGMLLLCLALLFSVSAVAHAVEMTADGDTDIPTAAGKEAPALDYELHLGTAALCLGLVIVFYVFMFWRSEKEFKKVIDVHFGPKE